MAKIVFAPEADDDLEGIVDYIARDKPIAARNWLVQIKAACEILATQPVAGEDRKSFGVSGCRSFSVGQYVIYFRAIPGGTEVARVIHRSRDM